MSTTELYAAFEANPADAKAFEALIKQCVAEDDRNTLEDVYDKVPNWAPDGDQNPLFRVLSTQARAAKGSPISSFLYYHNGLLLWQRYEEPQKAEMSFRKVEEPPADPSLLRQFYLDYYTAQNNWRRLEQFLSDPAKGGMEDPVEVKRLLARLAVENGQADKAITFWQGVRTAEPDDAEAEKSLRTLYAQVGKWHAMIDLLKDRLKNAGDDRDEKAVLLLEMVDIYKNKMNAASKVVGCWQQLLDFDPGNKEALDALAAEYEGMKRWPDLVKVLHQKIEHCEDPQQLIALHTEVATIMVDRFSNTSEAIKSYEAILELDAENTQAMSVLKEIYESRRDWESYITIGERELGLLPEGEERHARFVELARLASERIRKPQLPISLWERVLNADETSVEALSQLEGLYEREKNFASLSNIIEKRVELEPEVATQVALLEKLGTIVSVRLKDGDRSAEIWRELLSRDPQHRKAQAELKKKFIAERDWENLEWFFRNHGETTDWVRTLESQAKGVDSAEERTKLLFKAAAVWKDELGETRRAVKNLEAVLDLEPQHAGAARMLIPIYREVQAWKSLPDVYDIVLDAAEVPAERREILLMKAELQEQRLGDTDAAFFAYVQAVSETPGDVDLHPDLRRLAEASQNWESYVYVLQDSVDQISIDQDRIEVLLEIARIYSDHLNSEESSLTFVNRVLALDEFNRHALDAAERAYAGTDSYDQLVLVFEKKLEVADDVEERKQVLFKLAAVWRDRVGANDEARAILREMLDDFPDESRVHDELIAIYLEDGSFEPLRDVLTRKRDVLSASDAPASAMADIEAELGMLHYGTRDEGDDVSSAIDHYEAALGFEPDHAAAVRCLEELLSDETARLRITRILEPVYQRAANWDGLTQMLEIQLTHAEQDEDQILQVELLRRLSRHYASDLDNRDLAWRATGRLFLRRPEEAEVRGEFQRLTASLERWSELVTLYTGKADEPPDRDSRLAIKLEIARNWHKRLGSLEDARVFYHKVLDEEPEHKEALDALEGIYVDLDRAEDLLVIYRRKIELTDDLDQKLDYLFRTSDIQRDRLKKPDEAIGSVQEALDLRPGDMTAIQRLDELYTHTERWQDLASTLEDTIALVTEDPLRKALLKVRLAGVNETHLDNHHVAIDLYASILESDSDNEAAIEALERLFEDEELAVTIAPILQPVYDNRGDWKRLIDVYCVREASSDGIDERVDWNYKVAELYEHLGNLPDHAFTHFQKAAALAPASERTLGELLRLADQLDNHGELILFLQQVVGDIDDDLRRKETHRTIAGLARDKTSDIDGAERQLRAILDIDASDMPATDALIDLYRGSGDNGKLVEMLLHKAPMDIEPELRLALHAEAGQISAEVLDAPEQAIEIYESLHDLDRSQTTALDALEGLYAKVEDWENLVRIYREKIDRADAVDDKKVFAAMMGHVQSDALDQPHDAIDTWHQILKWDPTESEALTQLDLLYTKQEDWFNLQDILRRIQAQADESGWEGAQFRIARLYEDDDKLGDINASIDAYGALLERNPGHEGAVSALKTILAERDAYERAFGVLRPVLESNGAHEDLWQQYEVLAGHQSKGNGQQVATLQAMASLAEHQLGDPTRALGAMSRAFTANPHDEHTVGELERLAGTHGFIEELVGIYANAADEADDDGMAVVLRLKTGALLMDQLGDAERATAAYRKVYDDFPDHEEAQDRLHRLYEQQGMAAELAQVLRQQVDSRTDPQQKIGYLNQLARVAEEKLQDTDAAYEAFTEILDLERNSPLAVTELRRLFEQGVQRLEISERLEPIYREQGAWDELDSLMRLKLDAISDPVDKMQAMRDIAQLNLEQERKTEALRWFGQAFRLDPEDGFLESQLNTLAEETESWAELKLTFMDAAEACSDAERQVTLWRNAAEISLERLADAEAAERIYRTITEADEENLNALRALDGILSQQQRWADLEPILIKLTQLDDVYDDERIRLLVRLAELYRERLDARAQAIKAYRDVLELNDMHEPSLQALNEMYLDDESWPELFDVLQRLSDITRDDAQRVRYAKDMALIAEAELGQPDKAVELLEDVLTISTNDIEAVHELQRLLGEQESWQALAEAYERELRMGIEDAGRRLQLHRWAGKLWQEKLDDPFQAQTSWQRAREEDPYDRESLDALRTLHKAADNEQALAEIISASLESAHYDDQERLALWRQLAELRTDLFGDHPGAIEAWRAVLELAPGDAAAIEALEGLYEAEGRWTDAVDLYRLKLSTIADEEQRLASWIQLGSIQQDNLQDVAAAAATYREILEFRPSHLEASRRLETIYEQTGQWENLGPLLLDRNEHLQDPEDRLMNLQRLSRIYEERLDEPGNAFLVLQRANEDVPTEPSVLAELERLAQQTGLWEELYGVYESTLPHLDDEGAALEVMLKSAGVQRDRLENAEGAIALYERVLEHAEDNEHALRALVELNESEKRWSPLVAAIDGLSEVTPDYGEKVRLLKRMAVVYEEELRKPDDAVAAWMRVLEVDELDREALTSLERLHVEREDWDALITVYEQLASLEPQRESELKLKIGGILETHLQKIDEAIDQYEEVLTYAPGNAIALERLEALYGDRDDWAKLVDVYERSYDAAQSDEDRIAMARNIALLQDEVFEDPAAAADSYHRVLSIDASAEDAVDALVRIYTDGAQWEDLNGLYESRYETADNLEARADALSAMAVVYRTKLDDVDNAIAMYERVLMERHTDLAALNALDEMYREQELWEEVLRAGERKLEIEQDPDARVALLCEQGKLAADELQDNYRAADSYQRVLAERPGHEPAVQALIAIHRADERHDKVVEVLEHKLGATTSEVERASIHVDLAQVLSKELSQVEAAHEHLEAAAQLDPESRRALGSLADFYMETEEWLKAMPLLELLVDKLDPEADRERLTVVHKRLGICAEAAYQYDQALDEFITASTLMPPDQETLRGLARLHYRKENYREAEHFLQQVLERYKSDLSSDEYIQLYMQLGESSLRLGNIDQAQTYLQQVVETEPSNAAALEQIVEVLEAHGDWTNAIQYREQLLSLKSDPIERYQILLAIGDIHNQRLGNVTMATDAYRDAMALEVFPKEPALKLVEISINTQDYPEAIRYLNRLIKLEDDPPKKAQFAYTAAVLYRDQLDDAAQAVKYFNLTLDNNVDNLQAFRTIDEMLTQGREWKPLEQNYRRMIQRVQKQGAGYAKAPTLLFMLYKGLGEIYRSRLKRADYAISAFELAKKQRPNDVKVREILADLYEHTKDGARKAIDEHRFLVKQRPDRFDSYHTLIELFKKVGQADAAWCVAGLLVSLNQATDAELQFYNNYLEHSMPDIGRVVDPAMWMQAVQSRGEDSALGRIFELVYVGLGKHRNAKTLKAYGIKRKNRINLDDGKLVNNTLKKVARLFGFALPEVYEGDEPTGVGILQTAPPALHLGSDVFSGRSEKELAFHLAKRLSYFHPGHVITTLYDRDALDHLFMAAAGLVDPNYKLPIPNEVPAETRDAIALAVADLRAVLDKSIGAAERQELTEVMEAYWNSGAVVNIGAWHRHCELTANHAGLLAANDIALVGQLLRNETAHLSKLKNSEKLKEFVHYVLSDQYLKLRQELGIQIDYSELLA